MGKRNRLWILLQIIGLLVLTGCGVSNTAVELENTAAGAELLTVELETEDSAAETAAETEAEEPAYYTFTDDLGREITLEEAPQRVAIMLGSYADIWSIAGGRNTIVAAANDTWTSFALELSEDVVNIGSHTDPSLEALLGADPDFVIASANTGADVELEETFEEMGLTVAYFDVETFQDYLRMLEVCSHLTGHPENYEQYGTQQQIQVEAAITRADGSQPTVLMIRAGGTSIKVKNSEGTVLGEMLADLDTINIADSDTALLENLSLEAILADDPEYIFVVFQGTESRDEAEALLEETLLSNPAWSTLSAVENGNYYVMDSSLYHLKPNDEYGLAYEQLADILYGEE